LDAWIGTPPSSTTTVDEEDLPPIGGVDDADGEGATTLEEEMTILSAAKSADLSARFTKTADGVYVEAKRGAIGGITQVPLYFYGLLLLLGWNEIVAVLRNPIYFLFLILLGGGAYITWTLNLWGPMLRMGDAAMGQGLQAAKERLRDFLEADQVKSAMTAAGVEPAKLGLTHGEEHEMQTLKHKGRIAEPVLHDDDDI